MDTKKLNQKNKNNNIMYIKSMWAIIIVFAISLFTFIGGYINDIQELWIPAALVAIASAIVFVVKFINATK